MSAGKSVEFYVRDVLKDQFGQPVVVGIPNNGVPIRIGDHFRLRYELEHDDILSGVPDPSRRNCTLVELLVERIDLMRKSVDELPHGVTGGLYLSGVGLDSVTPTCFLRTEESA